MANRFLAPVFVVATGVLSFAANFSTATADDWTRWRGANGDNHAASNTDIPTQWNLDSGQNVLWQTKIPGRGHSSPVVVGESIFLTTASSDDKTQSLLKVDRLTGRLTDQWVLHRGTLPARIHPNNSYASPTPAFDGEALFVAFHTDDSIMLSKVTTEGNVVWQKRVGQFKPSRYQFGYGASPLLQDDLVIVACEYDGRDSGLYALDRKTGEQVWKVARPENLNFASPIAATIAGKRQVLLAGADMMVAYDPATGRELWSTDESTEAICGTVVWDGDRVVVSGGNPVSGTWCVSGDGSGKHLWDNRVKCYEQSLLAVNGYIYGVADNGVAYCWRSSDGEQMWKKRLFGGGISSSPLLVKDRFYVASEDGELFVIRANPDRFELIATLEAGDSAFATPVAVDDQLYLRIGKGMEYKPQEFLVAIAAKTSK